MRLATKSQATMSADVRAKLLRLARLTAWIGIALWWFCLRAYCSRSIFLFHYTATGIVAPKLELVVPSANSTFWSLTLVAIIAAGLHQQLANRWPAAPPPDRFAAMRQWLIGNGLMLLASAPWLIDLVLHWQVEAAIIQPVGIWGPSVWQPLWLSLFAGLAAGYWARCWWILNPTGPLQGAASRFRSPTFARLFAAVSALAVGGWWFWQSWRAYDVFQLGFNDCGHFAQRLSSTANGQGWLIESPVLPPFWDHFNPGLTLLVPLWIAWPHVSMTFLVQAICLAGSALPVMWLARCLGASPWQSAMWSLVWLVHPVVGQMNLAYSYGWHPISLAIPLLVLALVAVSKNRWWAASFCAILASSMEEGVLVIIATTAATWALFNNRPGLSPIGATPPGKPNSTTDEVVSADNTSQSAANSQRIDLSPRATWQRLLDNRAWLMVALCATIAFVVIYRFSGLAEFQTGRFNLLGSSLSEILLSPIQKPEAFWGLVFRNRNAIFLCGLLLPFGITALARSWTHCLPVVLPLAVLLMWNHEPAQSLAFHYPSTLMPVLMLAAITAATCPASHPSDRVSRSNSLLATALVTALTASFTFGQMPWSTPTLEDVNARTFDGESDFRRLAGSEDQAFIARQLAQLNYREHAILATGRLATRLVGAKELETVGQFEQRRVALSRLTPQLDPLLRYDLIVLDRLENFQQSREQTRDLESAARQLGFQPTVDEYEFVILERR